MSTLGVQLVDMRHVIRSLARAPAFSVTVVATLAVCVGAATAVFSVVNSVLLKPLSYPQPEQLVAIWHAAPGAPGAAYAAEGLRMSPSMFATYANENRAFEHVGMWLPLSSVTVTEPDGTTEARSVSVTDGLLQTLAVPPLLGRPFLADEHVPGAPPVVLLSYGYWQQRFGGDESVVGRTMTINDAPFEIIGVMPPRFRVVDLETDLIIPLRFDHQATDMQLLPFCCRGVARLRPGMGMAEATADIERMLPIWMDSATYDGDAREEFQEGWRIAPALRPLKQEVVGTVSDALWTVMGTIAVVLLIGCGNAVNLSLVRTAGRARELAVRAALGAGSWRIGRALLAENLLLGILGGLLGLAVASAALQLLIALEPSMLPRVDEIELDARSIAFALCVALLSGLVVGSIPALKHARRGLSSSLQAGGRNAGQSRESYRTQHALVIGQVALTAVLLVSAGLMIRTVHALLAVEPGFTEPTELQTLRVNIHRSIEADPERVTRLQNEMLDAIEAIPGVTSAAFASAMPMEDQGLHRDAIEIQGRNRDASSHAQRVFKSLSPGFLETAGMRLIAGREISWTDVYERRPLVMVSANLATEIWGHPDAAIGQRIRTQDGTPWREIVGVVQDVAEYGLREPPPTIVYWPSMGARVFAEDDPDRADWLARSVTIVARSTLAGTEALHRQIEQAVRSVSAGARVSAPGTMQEPYRQSLAPSLFALLMLGIAGAVALSLGVIGLYGVLTYVIARRRSEVAIRLALGGRPADIRRWLIRYGVVLVCVGTVVGLAIAIGVTRMIAPLLFEVGALDATTYFAVALVLLIVAVLASYVPAYRASVAEPASVLAVE
jgi:predicted permease